MIICRSAGPAHLYGLSEDMKVSPNKLGVQLGKDLIAKFLEEWLDNKAHVKHRG